MTRVLGRSAVSICTAVFVLAVALDAPAAIRGPIVGGYLVVCPGWAWVRRVHLPDRGDRLTVAVVMSVCAMALVGGTLALAQSWDVWRGMLGIVVLTTAGDALTARSTHTRTTTHRRRRRSVTPDVV